MAGLIERTTTLIKAKYSKLLNRAEKPSETLDYSYERQLELLQNVKRGVADVVTAKKRLQLQTQTLEQNVLKLDTQARQAVSQGREDLARQALERKSAVQQQLQGLDGQIKQLEAQLLMRNYRGFIRGFPLREGSDQGAVLGCRGAGANR